MKKLIALILSLLLLAAAPALAEGKLIVAQENLQKYLPYVFLMAKLTNTGDEPVEISSTVEMYDMDGEAFRSAEYTPLGDVLNPGESCYAYFGVYLYGDTQVKDYASEAEAMEVSGETVTIRYESKAELKLNWGEGWDTGDYVFITFTNTTDETIFGPNASAILLDGEGNILYLTVPIQYDLGITPGSTVIFRCEIPPYVLNSVPTDDLTVDSTVYTNVSAF